MHILFTSSGSLLSRAIRAETGEPVSHVAIQHDLGDEQGPEVIHSNLLGVHRECLSTFEKHSWVVYSFEVPGDAQLWEKLRQFEGASYDFGGLLYLALKQLPILRNLLPKKNLWQTTGMFLCTEWVTSVIFGKEDHTITPYQLYCKLTKDTKQ